MRPRQARKIVNRVQSGQVRHSSYSPQLVTEAFAMMGETLTEEHLKPWHDHIAEAKRIEAEKLANAPTEEARRKAKAARIAARAQAAEDRRALIRQKEAEKAGKAIHNLAAAAGREAFKQGVENEIDELPESVHLETGLPDLDAAMAEGLPADKIFGLGKPITTYPEMSVKDLKAECKARGLKGYSALKREALTAMLTVSDNDL
jgi:hypothetical protein